MNAAITFISNDLKIIFRDKTLSLMFFIPIILILFCRIVIPYLAGYVPEVKDYYTKIQAGFCVLSGALPAFLTAFLMLDEKDENLIPVLKIMPYSYQRLITFRISFLMLMSFIFSIIFLVFNGLARISFIEMLLISILVAFIPAILILVILPFARNKIEGVTLFKAFNSILFIPLLAFFVPEFWSNFFGIIPFYWVYKLLITDATGTIQLTPFLAGLFINIFYLYLFYLLFNKKFINKANHN